MHRKAALLTIVAAAFVTGACDSPTSNSGSARLTVLLTDAPHEYLESAHVTIGRVDILPMDGPALTISNGGSVYDLLLLQNGATAELGSALIEPGTYRELRLVVESATLTLKDGYTFTDGSTTQTLHVPSGAKSGIKIKLAGVDGTWGDGFEIVPGEMVLVVDFDVSQNFVMQGNADTPAGIKSFLFTPVLRATVRDVAGSIAGTVTAPAGVDVEGLTVSATPKDAGENPPVATSLVDEDGNFKIHFLAPGTYLVTVSTVPAGHVVNTVEVTVAEKQDVTGVELEIETE
jgi:hypothetical protein